MADLYVRSTDGNDGDGGTTWALAKATLAGAAAIDGAGDRIFISQNHAESTAGAVTFSLAGTIASPTLLLCGNDGAEPPNALAATGSITTTGANGITINGCAYVYGLTFNIGTGASAVSLLTGQTTNHKQTFENCTFNQLTTSAGSEIAFGVNATVDTTLLNCGFKFSNVGQVVSPRGRVRIFGGSVLAGGSTPTYIFEPISNGTHFLVDGFDFSNLGAGFHLLWGSNNGSAYKAVFRNCKLPAGWSGSLFQTALTIPGPRAEMWNCDAGDTNYRLWVEDYCGSIKSETTLVKTGGATDGDTPLSWKMVTGTDAEYPLNVLRSPEIISERITAVGAPKTITVDILHDSATALKDDEIWIEVQYLGTNGFPLGTFISDAKAGVLAAGANQAASAAAWTTTGMGNPNTQKLEVTFTPQEKGVAIVTVCVAKASYTAYVDRVAVVS